MTSRRDPDRPSLRQPRAFFAYAAFAQPELITGMACAYLLGLLMLDSFSFGFVTAAGTVMLDRAWSLFPYHPMRTWSERQRAQYFRLVR